MNYIPCILNCRNIHIRIEKIANLLLVLSLKGVK